MTPEQSLTRANAPLPEFQAAGLKYSEVVGKMREGIFERERRGVPITYLLRLDTGARIVAQVPSGSDLKNTSLRIEVLGWRGKSVKPFGELLDRTSTPPVKGETGKIVVNILSDGQDGIKSIKLVLENSDGSKRSIVSDSPERDVALLLNRINLPLM